MQDFQDEELVMIIKKDKNTLNLKLNTYHHLDVWRGLMRIIKTSVDNLQSGSVFHLTE